MPLSSQKHPGKEPCHIAKKTPHPSDTLLNAIWSYDHDDRGIIVDHVTAIEAMVGDAAFVQCSSPVLYILHSL